MASGDWILVLDGDERLEASREQLDAAMAQDVDGLYTRTIADDSWSYLTPRMFKNRPDIRYSGRIHEMPPVNEGIWGTADVQIRHVGYTPEVMAAKDKQRRNLALLERCVAEAPDEPYPHFGRAILLLALGEVDEAERESRRAADLWSRDRKPAGYVAQMFLTLSRALGQQGNAAEAFEYAREAALATGDPEALYEVGSLFAQSGQYGDALPLFHVARDVAKRALAGEIVIAALDPTLATWRTDIAISQTLRSLSRISAAPRRPSEPPDFKRGNLLDLREYLLSEPLAGIIKPADCPEWDKPDDPCHLEVREMDILTRASWRQLSYAAVPGTDGPGKEPDMIWDQPRSNAALIVLCTFYRTGEKAGQRVFQDGDVDVLLRLPGKKHEAAINRLLGTATDVNFLGSGIQKAAAKNSKSTRTSGTSSK